MFGGKRHKRRPGEGRHKYDADTHQRAWERYYVLRSQAKVAEELGCSKVTIFWWARKDFQCGFGCPFHGYDMLVAERERDELREGAMELTEQEEREKGERAKALVSRSTRASLAAANEALTWWYGVKDRLVHWSMIYAKAYSAIAGEPLPFDPSLRLDRVALTALYQNGEMPKSFESAVNAMKEAETQIRAIVEESRPKHSARGAIPVHAREVRPEGGEKLGLVELRELRRIVETMDERHIALLIRAARSGDLEGLAAHVDEEVIDLPSNGSSEPVEVEDGG